MDIFMRSISYDATEHDLVRHLSGILHHHPFKKASDLPMNFHVHLFKDKYGIRKHGGRGILTLPSSEAGEMFLQLYESGGLVIYRRPVAISRSNKPIREDVLQYVKNQLYVDPTVRENIEKKQATLSQSSIPISSVQFGWDCRDGCFSIEWEARLFHSSHLKFNDEKRQIRVEICNFPGERSHIVIQFSQIDYLSAHLYLSKEPVILLWLYYPPSFESPSVFLPDPRQRLSCLPFDGHEKVVPYTSHILRIVCRNADGLETFKELANLVRFDKIHDFQYPICRRNIFSSSNIDRFEEEVSKFNWCVAFQIISLVRDLLVDIHEMLLLMPRIHDMVKKHEPNGKTYTATFLRHFYARAELFFAIEEDESSETLEDCFLKAQADFAKQTDRDLLRPTDGSLFWSLHITVTPTTMRLDGPFLERSNRVIRRYDPSTHESFLRVSFLEEDHIHYRFDREIDGTAFIKRRIGQFLLNGLTIAGRTFQFLAYSQSALKEHTVWFVKPFKDPQHGFVNAERIIRALGSFKNLPFDQSLTYCPARYAARIAQAFTATDASVSVEQVEEILYIGDAYDQSKQYCFTDGVGTISKELADEIHHSLQSRRRRGHNGKNRPCAFQVRFMGSKGMLAIDYKLKGRAVCLRPSMIKFEAPESREIEIAQAFTKPGLYFLNRPLIMTLEWLGVPYETFKAHQDQAIQQIRQATDSLTQAARMLETYGLGTSFRLTSIMLGLARLDFEALDGYKFWERMMEYAVYHILRALKNHARIPIPGAWTLVGIADEHNYLKENEIYACVKPVDKPPIYLQGPVLISRSPTIHPGDVQIAIAIGRPPAGSCFAHEPLSNTVVFSVNGSRPLASCLGGGDLDGDLYNLIPLNDLPEFFPKQTHQAAAYKPAKRKLLHRECNMNDVAEFVMEYINSDVLGLIATNWLILADQHEKGIFAEECLKLAELHSDAVDYPKSGNAVALKDIPLTRFLQKPDWYAPETAWDIERYYQSNRAIGRLFRAVELPKISLGGKERRKRRNRPKDATLHHERLNRQRSEVEQDIEDVIEDYVGQFIDTGDSGADEMSELQDLFASYKSELQSICIVHTLGGRRSGMLTEEEAMIGTIAQKTSQPRKRADTMAKLREKTDILVRGLRESLAMKQEIDSEEHLRRAWMAWLVSLRNKGIFGGESFGWVALAAIFEAIKDIEEELGGR